MDILIKWILSIACTIQFFNCCWAFTNEELPAQCRPVINIQKDQYIIGYGSLMDEDSKRDDAKNVGDNYPIYIQGFERGWIEHSTDNRFGTTYLGVKKNAKSKINAVYFKLNQPRDILKYDNRENTYCRELVRKEQISSASGQALPEGQYWIYTTVSNQLPSIKYPLVQSYIDIFLQGCFKLEQKYHVPNFAMDCIKTTKHWSSHWKNDRVYPRTAIDNIPYAFEIDEIIEKALPEYYQKIEIE